MYVYTNWRMMTSLLVGWQRLEELKRNHEMEMAEVLRKSRYENGEKLEAMQRGYDKQVHELNVSAAWLRQAGPRSRLTKQ